MSEQWYLYKDNQQKGPYSFEQLAREAQQGLIGPADLVWHKNLEGWIRADQVEQLLPVIEQAGSASPAVGTNQGIFYHDNSKLMQLRTWLGFVGIVTIIGGVISAISGLFALIIGAIPGVIAVILGIKLFGAKKALDAMLQGNSAGVSPDLLDSFIDSLRGYFKLMGILIIISVVLGFLVSILAVIASLALPGLLEGILNVID